MLSTRPVDRALDYVDRPPGIWLAGYDVVRAAAGQRVTAQVRVAPRAFQHWSVTDHAWRTEPGTFRVTAGPSIVDQPLAYDIEAIEAPSSQVERA